MKIADYTRAHQIRSLINILGEQSAHIERWLEANIDNKNDTVTGSFHIELDSTTEGEPALILELHGETSGMENMAYMLVLKYQKEINDQLDKLEKEFERLGKDDDHPAWEILNHFEGMTASDRTYFVKNSLLDSEFPIPYKRLLWLRGEARALNKLYKY